MKNLYFLITFVMTMVLFGCNNSQNRTETAAQDSLVFADTKWISDNLGISDNLIIADTLQRNDDKLFAYGSYIRLPKLYSKSSEFELFNNKIASDFDSIVKQVSANPKDSEDEYHKIFFDYILYDSIITVKITNLYAYHLSEATPEYSVYHFDFKNNKLLNTNEMFAVFGLSQVPVLSAFAEQCTMPPDHTEPLFDINWFNQVKFKEINLLNFYMNHENKIVILYPLAENGIEAEQILE